MFFREIEIFDTKFRNSILKTHKKLHGLFDATNAIEHYRTATILLAQLALTGMDGHEMEHFSKIIGLIIV